MSSDDPLSKSLCDKWDHGLDPGEKIPMDLHTAAALGEYDTVRMLLGKGEDPNVYNIGGWTPLIYASFISHDNIVNLLLENPKINVDARAKDGTTALMWAAACGSESVLYFLLSHNADKEAKDNDGKTALFHGVAKGNQETVKMLLEHGANIEAVESSKNFTPLLAAAVEGHEIVVQLLLNHGANVTAKDKQGRTARMLTDNSAIVNLLDNVNRSHENLRSEAGLLSSFGSAASYSPSPEPGADLFAGPAALSRLATSSSDEGGSPTYGDSSRGDELEDFLNVLKLQKYLDVFRKEEIDFPTLITMDEADLKAIGLVKFGPRRKIHSAIKRWHEQQQQTLNHPLDASDASNVEVLTKRVANLSSSLSKEQHARLKLEEELQVERQLRSVVETERFGQNNLPAINVSSDQDYSSGSDYPYSQSQSYTR